MKYYRTNLLLGLAAITAIFCQICSGQEKKTTEDSIIALGGRVQRDKEGHIAEVRFGTSARIVAGEFSRFRELPHLTELSICFARPSHEDLKVISSYPRLRHVEMLNCSTMDSQALRLLLTNKRLEVLMLDGGAFDDDALEGIAELRNLKELWLRKTKVSSQGAIAISGCRSLTFLNLSSTQIDDTATSHLSALPRLTSLDLHNTNLTDKSVKSLGAMKQLRILDLNDTRITEEGLEELRRLLPECKVYGGK